MLKIALILTGGGLGALSRYALAGFVHRFAGAEFPWGTLLVNLLGCFLVGFLWKLAEDTTLGPNSRAFLFIGLLGGFTTFSTYGLETANLVRDSEWTRAALNLGLSNLVGLFLVFAGAAAARATLHIIR